MKAHAWLIGLALLSACTRNPQPDSDGAGYVQARLASRSNVVIEVNAPTTHPLFLANCDGQVNWFLVDPGRPKPSMDSDDILWGQATNACMSAPIRIAPGQTRQFVMPLPRAAEAPASGRYRVLFPNVHADWPPPDPGAGVSQSRRTQVAHDLLTSGVIVLD